MEIRVILVFSKKEFPKEPFIKEWQFYIYYLSTSEIIPGMGNELEYVI